MFIDPLNTPSFKRTMFNAIVAPRPVGWISTMSADGKANLAPYSQFNLVSTSPPVVMFSSNKPDDRPEKDSLANVRATGEFIANLATWDLREAVNISSTPAPHGVDEFELAGLEKADGVLVRVPRVAASPANLECRLIQIIEVKPENPGETLSCVVFGRVVGVHLDERYLTPEGRFDTTKAQVLCRLGGAQYSAIRDFFEMTAPFKHV